MKTALEFFSETEHVSTETMIDITAMVQKILNVWGKPPWYYMPYILSGRLSIGEMKLKEDGWMHPIDLSKWVHPLYPRKK